MNRKNPKSVSTPKKMTTRSSKTSKTKIAVNSTPVKTENTPNKPSPRRSRSRTLPKSPISESMKQMRINDFFKPVSPSVPKMEPNLKEVEIIDQFVANKSDSSKITKRRVTKDLPKTSEECPQTRYSLRNSNSFVKKLRFNSNEPSIEQKIFENNCVLNISDEPMDVSQEVKQTAVDKMVDHKTDLNLDQMMDGLELSEKKKNLRKTRKTSTKTKTNKSVEKEDNPLDEDLDLMPVFSKSKVVKEKENLKKNINKFVDKEKDKKLNYFLKNLSNLKKDKEMLNIEPFEQMEKEMMANKSDDMIIAIDSIKPFTGIDCFSDLIPKSIELYLTEETIEKKSSKILENICELPLKRLLPVISLVIGRLEESERQKLVSHIINLVSVEDNPVICSQSEHKIMDTFSGNQFEINLSLILKDFYKILNRISMNLKKNSVQNQSDVCHQNEESVEKELNKFLNVLKLMSRMFDKCLFKIEAIDSGQQLIELLILSFSFGLDYRLIKNSEHLIEIKKFISHIIRHLCVDDFNAITIIEELISFCSSQPKDNLTISLQILSLFPLNIDFKLKRKFCVSVIQLFVPKVHKQFEFNFNGIYEMLEQIDWKTLSAQDIYLIIQMIGLSMDLPKDLMEHKDWISIVLSNLDNKINSSVPKALELEFSEIHKLLMILRTKVNVSTKRF